MYKYDFAGIEPLTPIMVAADVTHQRSREELAALAELHGERSATLLEAPWLFVERRTAQGKPYPGGSFALLRSTVDADVEIAIHREDLRHVPKPAEPRRLVIVPTATPALVPSTSTETGSALAFKLKPEAPPWAYNVRVAAVYLDVDLDGQVWCSVVVGKPGKAVLSLRAAAPEDLEALGPAIMRQLSQQLKKKLCPES